MKSICFPLRLVSVQGVENDDRDNSYPSTDLKHTTNCSYVQNNDYIMHCMYTEVGQKFAYIFLLSAE